MSDSNSRQPNVIFILTDDQGPWAAGCCGNDEVRTPNIDRLAETGVRFENFFCTSPVCSPARASLMTGTDSISTRRTRLDSRWEYAAEPPRSILKA